MTQAIGETYKQTGGRSMPMQPCLIEGLAEIYVTPTPRVLAGGQCVDWLDSFYKIRVSNYL